MRKASIRLSYSPTQNNGQAQASKPAGKITNTYTYDALNRLSAASGPDWGTTSTYDGFGNLTDKTVTSGSAPPFHVTVNAATNRISTSGYTYDGNGNLTAIPGVGAPGYDVENRMTSVALTSGGTGVFSGIAELRSGIDLALTAGLIAHCAIP